MFLRRAICLALVLGVVAAACSSSKSSSSTSTSSSSTPATPPDSAYASGGNFTVGVVTLFLPGGDPVEVWYPANGSVGVGSDTYDVRAFLPSTVAAKLGASAHIYVGTDATRNVKVGAPGEQFPLVVLSHGAAGFRDEATFLTTRLASWGMIVAVPEDGSRDLAHALAPTAGASTSAGSDLTATIALLQQESSRVGGPFQGRVDVSKVAVIGLDTGAANATAAAADSRVKAYVALAPAAMSGALPAKPSLFVAGTNDRVEPAAAAASQFGRAPAPSYEWLISGAGHNAFDDLCVAAKPQGGLVKVLTSAGTTVSAPVRAALSDGCTPPAVDVLKTWPIIDEVVTAFLRRFIGPDATPVRVGPSGVRTIAGVKVTISARAS